MLSELSLNFHGPEAPRPPPRLTSQPMFEAMLQHYKELLQGGMICIQAAGPGSGADWSKTLMLSFIMCIRLTRSSIIWPLEAVGGRQGQLR